MDNQHKTYSKTIKQLKSNATKGNLLSIFQLYENYKSGKNVEAVNEELAQTYLESVSEKLPSVKFRLKSIDLYNFRRLTSLDLTFNDKLTIIIGNNGSGKTAIVESLAKTFTWFNNALKNSTNGRPVTESDVNVNAKDFAEIVTNIEMGKKTSFETVIYKLAPESNHSKSTKVSDIKLAGSLYRHLASNDQVNLPLLAYYSVERSDFTLQQTYSESARGDVSTNRFDSLDDALDGTGKLDKFSQLYIELVNLADGEVASEVKALRQQITNIESILAEAYEGEIPSKSDPVVKKLELKKKELKAALDSNCSVKHQNQLALVNKAIETIVPDVTDLEVDRSSGKVKLMVKNFGNRVNISQLSQGQKTLVALIGDIARRLVILNPNSENALARHGIVIIDEVELHLHPKWQQEVLVGLQKVFSNIQFIVTTHSPQVLSHIDPKHTIVIKLSSEKNQIKKVIVRDTYGRNADLIYEGNMGVTSRPEEIQSKIEEIFQLIEQKDLSKAKSEIASLSEKIGDDGQLVKVMTLIKRMELIGK